MGPEWSSSEPSSPTEIDRSERNSASPKNSKYARPTGDFRNAVPPVWPGVCHEYSYTRENCASARNIGGSTVSR